MSASFLDHISGVDDPRVPGMVAYRLDEILFTVLVGLLCRAEDFDEIEDVGVELLGWLRRILPFAHGIAPAQTLKRTLARLDPRQLETAFAAWVESLAGRIGGVIAIDGKTLRGSKRNADRTGALHLVQAYAHEAGLVLASRAEGAKSNEITAIPELLDLLAIERTIRAAYAAWLAKRHPGWKGLASILALTLRRTIKKTGAVSIETRRFISSVAPDPVRVAGAV